MRKYLQIRENGLLYRTQRENKALSLRFSTEFRHVIKVLDSLLLLLLQTFMHKKEAPVSVIRPSKTFSAS